MQVRLLGPVDVLVDGEVRLVPGLRRKTVLAMLALQAGAVVSVDRLVECVWGEAAPLAAQATLQSHVSYLRRTLGERAALRSRPPGYVLEVGDAGTDVRAAERLILEGTQATDPRRGAALLCDAVALWRGSPLEDVAETAPFDDHARRLDHLLRRARQSLIDRRLSLGEHSQLIPELDSLSRFHPLDERVHGQLMLALYRAGRQADALAVYERLRAALDEELAVEPGPSSRALERSIRSQDPTLDIGGSVTLRAPVRPPAQLPAAVPAFTGRGRELNRLQALWAGVGSGPVSVIVSGTAGVGKSALAVHWARRVADRFPDGQLHVNLRGFDPVHPPMPPETALRGLIEAFGVPVERLPADLDALSGLYRSLLTGRRMLVVLDNARDAAQVRPLLPGSPGCLAIVTSRNQLASLVATEGAHSLSLGLLTDAEARALLAGRLGADRLKCDPDAVREIIERTVRLPLALAVAAAAVASQPQSSLVSLARDLRENGRTLDALDDADPVTDIRAVFSWSCRALSTGAARMFRLLGLHPGPDVTVPAAASLAGIARDQCRKQLAELVRANLLTEHVPGRYTFHDLLRAYATEQALALEEDDDRWAAIRRAHDHYVHTALLASRRVYGPGDLMILGPLYPGVVLEEPADECEALSWLTAEHRVLLAAVEHADAHGFSSHAWRLALTLRKYLRYRCHWHELPATHAVAHDAARRIADVRGQALAHLGLGGGCSWGVRDDAAADHLEKALLIFSGLGDLAGQGLTRIEQGILCERSGRRDEAIERYEQAFVLCRAAGHRTGQSLALNNIAWICAQSGTPGRAVGLCREALELLRGVGDRPIEAAVLDTLGYAFQHVAEYRRALAAYAEAVELYRAFGGRYHEAETLARVGDTYQSLGDPASAARTWRRALTILEDIDHRDADDVRRRLQVLGPLDVLPVGERPRDPLPPPTHRPDR